MKLSAHFDSTEWECRHCHQLPDQAFGSVAQWEAKLKGQTLTNLQALAGFYELDLAQRKVSPQLLIWLEQLREKLGPIKIVSGYRCPEWNKKVGGVKNSQHLKGTAADIVVKRVHPGPVQSQANLLLDTKGGIGSYAGFTHIDSRSRPSRWTG